MAQILNVSLPELIKPKLAAAMGEVKETLNRNFIFSGIQACVKKQIFAEAMYYIPEKFQNSNEYQSFIETFSATSALNFDSLNEFGEVLSSPDLKKLLSDMSENDPNLRPSAEEIVLRLTQIEKTIKNMENLSRTKVLCN